jgi:4-hydroxy-2-oxoheptanedioate aldolase
MTYRPKLGFWLSDAGTSTAEIVAGAGFDFVVLDAEHGAFGLETLERFIPLLQGLGLQVLTKVYGPAREPVQQALDFGSNGVIIPHVEDLARTAEVASFTKYPPLGARSMAGGRVLRYGGWDDEIIAAIDAATLCLPLIEDPRAVADVEEILALPTVDGFQMGPGDLSLTSGRGAYKASEADWADAKRCAAAAVAAGKTWLYPAWTERDKRWALEHRAPMILVSSQFHVVAAAVRDVRSRFDELCDSLA